MKPRLWPILIVSALIFAAMLGCGLQGDYPAPALGVFVDGNLGVVEVLAGGAAEKAGVQVGDVLVSLNGTTLASVDDWSTALSVIEVGQAYDLAVQRAGQSTTLRVKSLPYPADNRAPGVTPTVVPPGIFSVWLLPEP